MFSIPSDNLDSFYQHHKYFYEGGEWQVAMKWQVARLQQSSVIFKVKWPRLRPHRTQNAIKYIAKSMAYIINKSSGDFEQRGCLYKPTSDS